jgi:hypothetical protein
MSLSGLVIIRVVKFAPALFVQVWTMLAPTNKSVALVVVTAPLLAVVLFPVEPTAASTGLIRSIPLYSKTRMSAYFAADANCTVTVFAPAAAAAIFFA